MKSVTIKNDSYRDPISQQWSDNGFTISLKTNTALLIIDMQNDFLLPGRPLYVDGAMSTVPQLKKLLDYARINHWTVIHVIREHDKKGINADKPRRYLFENGQNGYCVAGTEGVKIIEELQPQDDEIIIKKTRNSAFFETNLDLLLRRLDIKNVVISGTQFPNCIRGTAVDAMSYDYDVTVITDCCSAKTPEIASANIRDMKNMGIECISFEECMKGKVI